MHIWSHVSHAHYPQGCIVSPKVPEQALGMMKLCKIWMIGWKQAKAYADIFYKAVLCSIYIRWRLYPSRCWWTNTPFLINLADNQNPETCGKPHAPQKCVKRCMQNCNMDHTYPFKKLPEISVPFPPCWRYSTVYSQVNHSNNTGNILPHLFSCKKKKTWCSMTRRSFGLWTALLRSPFPQGAAAIIPLQVEIFTPIC